MHFISLSTICGAHTFSKHKDFDTRLPTFIHKHSQCRKLIQCCPFCTLAACNINNLMTLLAIKILLLLFSRFPFVCLIFTSFALVGYKICSSSSFTKFYCFCINVVYAFYRQSLTCDMYSFRDVTTIGHTNIYLYVHIRYSDVIWV